MDGHGGARAAEYGRDNLARMLEEEISLDTDTETTVKKGKSSFHTIDFGDSNNWTFLNLKFKFGGFSNFLKRLIYRIFVII